MKSATQKKSTKHRAKTSKRCGPSSQKTISREKAMELVLKARSNYRGMVSIVDDMIRGQAHKALGYRSLKAMWDDHLSFYSYSYHMKLQKASKIHKAVAPEIEFGVVPEYLYRPLVKVPKENLNLVWDTAVKKAGAVENLTKKHMDEAAAPYLPDKKISPEEKPGKLDKIVGTSKEVGKVQRKLDDYDATINSMNDEEAARVIRYFKKQNIDYKKLSRRKFIRLTSIALLPSMKYERQKLLNTIGGSVRIMASNMVKSEVKSEAAKKLCLKRMLNLVNMKMVKALEGVADINAKTA